MPSPSSYAEIFTNLSKAGFIPKSLGDSLADAAKMRNRLIHLYLEVDDREVFAARDHLDDLREFAVIAQEWRTADERSAGGG